MDNPRQVALLALQDIYRRGAYSDVALDRVLGQANLSGVDRGLVCELVYGTVRRQRTLDALIDRLGKKKSHQQPPNLRLILQLGLYQLRYLNRVPDAAIVDTSVKLAQENGLSKLGRVVNAILRQYLRLAAQGCDPLILPEDTVPRLGILHSFPDWIVQLWLGQLSESETEQLCQWFNQPPPLDLRINPLRTTIDEVETALIKAGVKVSRVPHLPQALRLREGVGSVQKLPGFQLGWWTVQDSSAQLVTHLLDPQPGETVIDVCAAPGGKTTHIAELMQDRGQIWAGDRAAKRLKRLTQNLQRLQLESVRTYVGDSRNLTHFSQTAERVLLDAPCSGLGTLHRRPDIRWRQQPQQLAELAQLQGELLAQAANWVKPGGILVYATCTLNPQENEQVIQAFLESRANWQLQPPPADSPAAAFLTPSGWLKIWPHRHDLDGFFLVKLKKG